ncbi:MAG: hypothetical protein JWM57_4328 [Phycisphaerales bacterium]|nr:hypothetical protein [Phycisphaerales bacterium]
MIAPELDRVSEAFAAVMAAREAGVVVDDLTRLCHGDAEVVAEVRSLLEHLDRAGDTNDTGHGSSSGAFLDCGELRRERGDPIAGSLLKEWGASSIGQKVGPYTLIGQLGSGGMAMVFLAEQDKPRRNVALKLVRRNSASDHVLRRFEREAEMHGCLSHPGIAQVYDAGIAQLTDEAGRTVDVPYLAMERVQGVNVADFCRAFGNDQQLVMGLVAQMCDAVQHAHQRGVIHRDLKPANVLVTGGSRGEATVKVLDFGVARLRSEDPSEALTRLTQHGYVLGTLAYMSPEQLGASCDVDTRGDVYALGVILFELLAGHLPIDLTGCGLAEAAVRITDARPPRLGTIERAFRGDVETIVAKALEKEPDRRYQSPAELAEDLRHAMAGEPIQARRDSITYTLTRQVVRYRSLAVVTMAMLLLGVVLSIYVHHSQTLQLRAVNAEAEALRREQASRRVVDGLTTELAERLSASRIREGRLLSASGAWVDAERPLWDEYLAHPDSLDAHWALRGLYLRSGGRMAIDTRSHDSRALAVSDNGLIAVADAEGMLRLWTANDGRPAGEIDTQLGPIRAAAFMGDNRMLAVAGISGACLATTDGHTRTLVSRATSSISVTPNLLVVGDDDGWLNFFTPAGEKIDRIRVATTAVRDVCIDASERRLVSIHNDGSMRLWALQRESTKVHLTPGPPLAGHTAAGRTVVFSPDGQTIASGGSDQLIRLWRTSDGEAITAIRTKNGTSRDIVFDPTGHQIAVTGYWRTQLFEVTGSAPYLASSRNIDGESLMCRFTDSGRTLVTMASAGGCHLWDVQPEGPVVLRGASDTPVDELVVTKSADGPMLISIQNSGQITARTNAADGTWQTIADWTLRYPARGVAFDPAKGALWVGRDDGHALAYDLKSGQIVNSLPELKSPVRTINLSPDGKTLVVGLGDGRVTFWKQDGLNWKQVGEGSCGIDVRGATISPDGQTLFTTHRTAIMRAWSMVDYHVLGECTRSTAAYRPDFSPKGGIVAAGDWDRDVHLWDAAAVRAHASPLLTLIGHNQLVSEVTYDDTGDLLASVATDGEWRLWDVRKPTSKGAQPPERQSLVTHDTNDGEAVTVRFIPGNAERKRLAVGYRDGTVRVWDLAAADRYLAGNIDYQRRQRAAATTQP